jgi:hypothetical protein
LDDLSLLGNAAAVPIIIAATQLLKKNFSFKYRADVLSFGVAMVICPLWWFYNTPEAAIRDALDDGTVRTVKFIISQFLVAVATYMSASKSYDLFSGNKKRDQHVQGIVAEKEQLQVKVKQLEVNLGAGGKPVNEYEDENEISDKLLDILEGRG